MLGMSSMKPPPTEANAVKVQIKRRIFLSLRRSPDLASHSLVLLAVLRLARQCIMSRQ